MDQNIKNIKLHQILMNFASVINSLNLYSLFFFGYVSQKIVPLIFKDLIYNNYEKP